MIRDRQKRSIFSDGDGQRKLNKAFQKRCADPTARRANGTMWFGRLPMPRAGMQACIASCLMLAEAFPRLLAGSQKRRTSTEVIGLGANPCRGCKVSRLVVLRSEEHNQKQEAIDHAKRKDYGTRSAGPVGSGCTMG